MMPLISLFFSPVSSGSFFLQDTKTIMMTNNTLLPINWKLSGLENLGEDFSVSAESGTVPPLTTLPFDAFFRAQKVQ